MTPREMKQFLIEERCVHSGIMALPTIPDFMQWMDARKAIRTISRVEKKVGSKIRKGVDASTQ